MLRLFWLFSIIFPSVAFGADEEHTAAVTRLEGEVRILAPLTGKAKTVRVQGKDYDFRTAGEGDRVGIDNTVQTLKGGRVRLVFPNGDQMTLGEHSILKLSLILNKKKDKPVMDLLFGKMRAVIQQDGPRSGSEVRTSSMVMGVRGTDFYVEGSGARSSLTVLRGEVVAREPNAPKKPEIKVASGFTLEAASATKVAVPVAVGKKELLAIQRETTVPRKTDAPEEVIELEKKALEAAKADLMKYDPEAAKTLADVPDADDIAIHAIKKNLQRSNKPSEEQLSPADEDVYQKYFKD